MSSFKVCRRLKSHKSFEMLTAQVCFSCLLRASKVKLEWQACNGAQHETGIAMCLVDADVE